MQQLTDDDLLIGNSNHDEKERMIPQDIQSTRQIRPEFSYFMNEEQRYCILLMKRKEKTFS